MKKTLLIYSRVCPTESLHTIKIFEHLKKELDIDTLVIDGTKAFDVKEEQKKVNSYHNLIFLFTMNWYNIPWNLSRYFIEVFRTFPFTLEGQNIYRIVTTGNNIAHYTKDEKTGLGTTALEYLNNNDGMLKKLRATIKDTYFYHDCVNYDEQRLNEFIKTLTSELKKI